MNASFIAGAVLAGFISVAVAGWILSRKKAKETQAAAARNKAAADHSQQNAEALAAHAGRVQDINESREDQNERIENGDADGVLSDVLDANNQRVSDDG